MSKISGGLTPIQEPDRPFDRDRTEMHVPLRRREIAVARELLDRSRRSATHRKMGTKRVPQTVGAARRDFRATRGASYVVSDDILREPRAVLVIEHPRPA